MFNTEGWCLIMYDNFWPLLYHFCQSNSRKFFLQVTRVIISMKSIGILSEKQNLAFNETRQRAIGE